LVDPAFPDRQDLVSCGGRNIRTAGANPAVLEGLSLDQIAADLSQPSSPVTKSVDGAANYLIAALCAETGCHRPTICSASFVATAQARMAASPWSQSPGAQQPSPFRERRCARPVGRAAVVGGHALLSQTAADGSTGTMMMSSSTRR
jgi:hypothetical protein